MKTAAAVILALGFACGVLAQGTEPDPALGARVRQWILNLGAEDPTLRDWAEQKLRETGAFALPDLRKAGESTDAEIAFRAQKLVAEIERGGKPKEEPPEDRSPKVVQVRQDPSGQITLVIQRTDESGQVTEEEVIAASLAELRREHPDLAKQIGATRKKGDPADQPLETIVQDLMGTLQDSLERVGKPRKGTKAKGKRGGPLSQLVDLLEQALDEPGEKGAADEEGERSGVAGSQDSAADLAQADAGEDLGPVPPDLRAHLGLDPGEGVLVGEQDAESRWAQAGVNAYDVIVSVSGMRVAGVDSLREAVSVALESGALRFDVVRRGQRQTIEVPKGVLRRFR